uniref:VQ domain-containing protein n=1 Tax=Oryza meridionalis TaxID=40149 RepID=A0A0E0E7P5_9ORYZ
MSSTSSSSPPPPPPPPSKAKRAVRIHGARPQPLIVSSAPAEASRPSKKPRVSGGGGGDTGPVIVYELTPRVVHVEKEEFMAVVQKLTGGKQPAAASTTVTLPAADQVAGGDHTAAAAAGADPLVLALGQQRQPASPAIDGDDHPAPPHSPPADAFLLSPSSFFLSPTTMHALQELAALVVHVEPEEFMAVVQKLTGKQSTAAPVASTAAGGGAEITDTAAATVADGQLVLAFGQQHWPAPPPEIDDDNSANLPSPSGGSIQGPRPQPLIVSPAAAAEAEASRPTKKPRVVAGGGGGDMGPVIVYELTPRVVHAQPEEFRAIVQKLTGKKSTATEPVPSDPTVTLPDLVAGGRAAAAADPLVLALGQQRQPAPPAIDDDDDDDHSAHLLPPPSPATASFLSPSSLFFSPTTMQALQELGVLF